MSEELKETTGHESYITEAEARVVLESGITAAKIDNFEDRIIALENGGGVTIDDTVVEGSTHAVSGGAVYTALSAKQDTLVDSQKEAVESGVTAAKVANYDAYNGRIENLETTITGLTGAMHFIGTSTTDPASGATISGIETFTAGDVCLYEKKEYIYNGSSWTEFGDEGSCLTKTEAASTYVPQTRTINGHALSVDVTIAVGDITNAVSTDTLNTAVNAKQDALSESQLAAANSGITADKVTIYDGYADNLGTKVVANDSSATATESLSSLTVAGTTYSIGGSDNAWTADNLQFTFDEEAGTVSITVVKSDGTTESGTVTA